MASITKNKLIALTVKQSLVITALGITLTGCEAPLNLEGVEKELTKSVRRTDHFQGIASNDQVTIAIGNDGLVLTSINNTQQWQRHSLKDAASLISISACPDQSFAALATNHTIWLSSDNGESWSSEAVTTREDLLSLTCAPDNSLWVTGSFSTILGSADKGKNWSENTLNEDAMLTGIQFVDDKTAILTGEFGLFSISEDGGQNWNTPEYVPNDFYTQGAYFTSAKEGWVGGLSGQILFTSDGGVNWSKQPTPTESPIYGFYKTGQRTFAFGDHSTVLEYHNGAWSKVPSSGKPVYIRSALQLDNGELLVAGGSGSLFSLLLPEAPSTVLSQN